ncbi:hypothetical protein ACFOYW_17020 [Gryllotalpicola reticulitermitis]|uniref:Ribbon-helix-helix protein CopG domain-containing protein n=1 Tax=Gryllotalpicola reticulitermitis TaxID=1184153 RepID=A0ABV8QAW3_9MICO
MSTRAKSQMSAADEAAFAAWSERIEAEDYEPDEAGEAYEGSAAAEASRAMLAELMGESAVKKTIATVGRPSLDGHSGAGESPVRRFRLGRELDAALTARERVENRKASAIIREAVAEYLHKAS